MESVTSLPANYAKAIKLIDDAHSNDPKTIDGKDGPVPYELHYAQKMTRWLASRCPEASPALQVACRAQHFRRCVACSRRCSLLILADGKSPEAATP